MHANPIRNAVILAVGFMTGALGYAAQAVAANPVLPIEGVAYQADWSLRDNLKVFEGKSVTLYTDAGAQFRGRVKAVGGGLLHLEKIRGREFFDALIRVERIEAIEARFRAYQRDIERTKKRQ